MLHLSVYSLLQKEAWEKLEKSNVLFFKSITQLKTKYYMPLCHYHIEKLYTSTMDPKFPEKMSILMSWPNVSLSDVTEGHFRIAILDT